MKKLLISLLVFALLMSLSAACADTFDFSGYTLEILIEMRTALNRAIAEQTITQSSSLTPAASFDGEILFRSIPWGSNAEEVKKKLVADGMISDKYHISNDDYMYAWKVDVDDYVEANAGARIAIYSFPASFKVAGYPLSTAHIYCPFSYSEDSVDRSIGSTQFMLATMSFAVTDVDLVFADLTNKLTSLYGIPEYIEDNISYQVLFGIGEDYTQYNSWNVWYGVNNTGVYLYKSYTQEDDSTTIESAELTLVYGKTNGIQYLENLMNAVTNEEKAQELITQQQNANNTDGL